MREKTHVLCYESSQNQLTRPLKCSVLLYRLFFLKHNSPLSCKVGITYVYIDRVFGFYDFFKTHLYCLAGYLSMIVLGVLYACVLLLHLFSTIEYVSHGKALKKYAHYYYYYFYIFYIYTL